MNYTIRLEQAKDYTATEAQLREAFWNLYVPGCNEHLIVHCLRKHPDFIKELSFVMELNGEIVGSIFYSKSKVVDTNGREIPTITFGPVGILPSLHRKGLGRALISHSIEEAKKLGYKAIIIGGFPHHYETYGFVGSKKYNIALPDNNYYKGIMALPLQEGALDNIKNGVIHFSSALEPDESCLDEFDAKFAAKQKTTTKSQELFAIAVTEIDES